MLMDTSLSQDGFYQKGAWVEHLLASLPPLTSKEPFCTCVVREVSWLQRWVICVLGKAYHPLSCLAILVLQFQSTGDESPVGLYWEAGNMVASIFWPQILPEKHEPQKNFIGKMKGRDLSSITSSAWQEAT